MAVVIFALTVLVFGLINLFIGFELLGRQQAGQNLFLRILHKVVGYGFVVFFLIIFAGMFGRLGYRGEFSAKAVMHITLAFLAVVLLAYKILTARRYKRFSAHLFSLGAILFAVCFTLVSLVAFSPLLGGEVENHSVATQSGEGQTGGAPHNANCFNEKMMPEEILLVNVCTQCHSLGQAVYGIHELKTEDEWTALIGKMRMKKPEAISQEQGAIIAKYLTQLAAE